MEELDLVRIVIGLAFFVFASASDWRTRRVPDTSWLVLGSLAIAILIVDMLAGSASLLTLSMILPIGFLFFDIYWDRERGIRTRTGFLATVLYLASFIWVAYASYLQFSGSVEYEPVFANIFMIFVIVIIFILFYMFDIIKGGADAKAVICLAILFPWYPAVSGLPIIVPSVENALIIFPFAFSVLFVGALISILLPIYFLIINIRSGNKLSARSLVGFRLPISDVEGKFYWLMEWVENGELRFSARKLRGTDTLKADLAALSEKGLREVWVTNKIPFIIPLTIGMLIVITIGNPIFIFY
ncbi:MAG: hypothetical protein OEV21_01900 [Thermoplasmata archaeon]|nr:hypothetical protein [Thermoplasmata archaeon]